MHNPPLTIGELFDRIRFAFRCLIGKYPLPTPIQELNMSAIEDLNKAVSDVAALVSSLNAEVANGDQTPAIEAATAALTALLPVAVAPTPVVGEVPASDPVAG